MAASKRLLTALLALGLGLVPAASGQNSGQTVRHVKVQEGTPPPPELAQAETAIGKQDYATAEPLLKTAVGHDPQNYVAWFDLGFVEHALGKDPDAITAYRNSVAAKADVFESNLNLGLLLAEDHQPDAVQFLRTATQLTPTANPQEGLFRAWLGLAHALEPTQPEKAIKAYQQAAALAPRDTEPHLSAGILLEKQKQPAQAEEEYKQALAIDPSSPDALTALTNLYMRNHQFAEAEALLRKLVAMKPQDPAAVMQLGRMLAAEGKQDEAIAQLQAAEKLAPQDAGLQRDLADLYFAQKKFALAEAQLRLLLASDSKNAELHELLGRALLEQTKYGAAQQEFLIALRLKPDLGAAYGDLAFAANGSNNYQLVIGALNKRATLLPETAITYFLRATAYDHLRDYKDAAVDYHKFLEAAQGKFPDQEWQARHRLIAIEPKKQ